MNVGNPSLGIFPECRNTVLAELPPRLVSNAVMTGVSPVFDANSTCQGQDVIAHKGALRSANSATGKHLTIRELRTLAALWNSKGWIGREEVDRVAGAANGPQVIMMLRKKVTGHQGLEMERVSSIDRDGKQCNPGRYRLNEFGRQCVMESGLLSEAA